MRGEAAARVPGAVNWGGRASGVLLVPGTYQIKLTAGGKSLTASAEIQKDPRVNVSQADPAQQYEQATPRRDTLASPPAPAAHPRASPVHPPPPRLPAVQPPAAS